SRRPVGLLPEHLAAARILEGYFHQEIDALLVDEPLSEREGLEPVAPDAPFEHEGRGADIVDQGQAVGLQELPSHELSKTLTQDRLEGIVVKDRHRQLQPPRGPRLDGRAELVPAAMKYDQNGHCQ